QIIDRYGNSFGKFTRPVEDGNILAYATRGLPYPESAKTYHQYEVVTDINIENVVKAVDNLPSKEKAKFIDDMAYYD
ncbi:TNT domain-containing protein, partial [Listeria monocytogenes]|nr:TNT domain-containing protein [Listeria monocytogenes]